MRLKNLITEIARRLTEPFRPQPKLVPIPVRVRHQDSRHRS
ncbi:MAG: hypothetical protein ACI9MC_000909 [Kiritimatiellia bacterium]|jgi:hypothetical protein